MGLTQAEMSMMFPIMYISASCAVPFWTWFSGRIGKDITVRRLLLFEIGLLLSAYFLIPNNKPLFYGCVVLAAIGWTGFLLVGALLADILDINKLIAGAQRAGTFLGFWTVTIKIAMAAGTAIVGWTLASVGYQRNGQQTLVVMDTMRLLYGPSPAVFRIAGYMLSRKFSFPRQQANQIRTELVQRRAAAAS